MGIIPTEKRLTKLLDDEKKMEEKEEEGGSHSRNYKRRGL